MENIKNSPIVISEAQWNFIIFIIVVGFLVIGVISYCIFRELISLKSELEGLKKLNEMEDKIVEISSDISAFSSEYYSKEYASHSILLKQDLEISNIKADLMSVRSLATAIASESAATRYDLGKLSRDVGLSAADMQQIYSKLSDVDEKMERLSRL